MRTSPFRDVSLTQLSYFVAACEHGSMTDAAASLFVAQSAVSASIGNLEESLGTQLFIRRRARGLQLTGSGTELLGRARVILSAVDDTIDALRPDTVAGTLQAACFPTLAPFYLPEIIHQLTADYPALELQISDLSAAQISDALMSRSIEVAITYNLGLDARIHYEKLATVPVYAAVSVNHRLAERDEVSLAELAAEPMVLLDMPVSRDYFLRAFTDRGYEPIARYRFSSFEAVRAMVAKGHGFALLNQKPTLNFTYDGGQLYALRITEDLPGMEIVIASLNGSDSLTRKGRAFAEQCRRTLGAEAARPGGHIPVQQSRRGLEGGGTSAPFPPQA